MKFILSLIFIANQALAVDALLCKGRDQGNQEFTVGATKGNINVVVLKNSRPVDSGTNYSVQRFETKNDQTQVLGFRRASVIVPFNIYAEVVFTKQTSTIRFGKDGWNQVNWSEPLKLNCIAQ